MLGWNHLRPGNLKLKKWHFVIYFDFYDPMLGNQILRLASLPRILSLRLLSMWPTADAFVPFCPSGNVCSRSVKSKFSGGLYLEKKNHETGHIFFRLGKSEQVFFVINHNRRKKFAISWLTAHKLCFIFYFYKITIGLELLNFKIM